MNRQRIYRGKRPDTGAFIEGGIFYLPDGTPCIVTYADPDKFGFDWLEVPPDTVGEFTGITDKKGKRVFEDDIARIKYEGKTYVGIIQYDALGVFIFVARGFGWVPLFKLADDEMSQRNGQKLTAIEIIGNIHDNPELLEAGK